MTAWLTGRAAAAELGVHPNTVRNYADTGLLKFRRLPSGFRRYSAGDVAGIKATMDMEALEHLEIGYVERLRDLEAALARVEELAARWDERGATKFYDTGAQLAAQVRAAVDPTGPSARHIAAARRRSRERRREARIEQVVEAVTTEGPPE